ncbi:MAG: endolysin/autolysin [Podoviridae sp. ctbj_2]|nr:MAG: endolysin/autolysin [Podoviridae sp. ctbj_2]
MAVKQRIAVSLLTISAAGFAGWQASESFVSSAMIPTKGDRPTIGYGSTFYEDGTAVKMGDTITRKRAEELARNLMSKDEAFLKKSLGDTPLHQEEYDVYVDFLGQYGKGNWKGKSIERELLAGNYVKACKNLLLYKYAGGFDCSTPGNKRCYGSWERQLERYGKCMGVQ